MMPSKGLKFLYEFLMPNLDSQRFGARLKWLNTEYSIFQVQWNHKSASGWTKDDAEVFMEWDKIKGRIIPDDKERFTKSKQRFRAIMYKLMKASHITEIPCSDKCIKIYCLGNKENIPNDVIVEAMNSRGNAFCEISSEIMYTYDPEAVTDINEISDGSFIKDNHINIIEDHKYASLKKEVKLESEDIVPDNHLQEVSSCDTQLMYVNIIDGSLLSEKQGAFKEFEDSYLQDHNGCAVFNIQWEIPENCMYEEYVCVPGEKLFEPEDLLTL